MFCTKRRLYPCFGFVCTFVSRVFYIHQKQVCKMTGGVSFGCDTFDSDQPSVGSGDVSLSFTAAASPLCIVDQLIFSPLYSDITSTQTQTPQMESRFTLLLHPLLNYRGSESVIKSLLWPCGSRSLQTSERSTFCHNGSSRWDFVSQMH